MSIIKSFLYLCFASVFELSLCFFQVQMKSRVWIGALFLLLLSSSLLLAEAKADRKEKPKERPKPKVRRKPADWDKLTADDLGNLEANWLDEEVR
jgi:hypothetical protein